MTVELEKHYEDGTLRDNYVALGENQHQLNIDYIFPS